MHSGFLKVTSAIFNSVPCLALAFAGPPAIFLWNRIAWNWTAVGCSAGLGATEHRSLLDSGSQIPSPSRARRLKGTSTAGTAGPAAGAGVAIDKDDTVGVLTTVQFSGLFLVWLTGAVSVLLIKFTGKAVKAVRTGYSSKALGSTNILTGSHLVEKQPGGRYETNDSPDENLKGESAAENLKREMPNASLEEEALHRPPFPVGLNGRNQGDMLRYIIGELTIINDEVSQVKTAVDMRSKSTRLLRRPHVSSANGTGESKAVLEMGGECHHQRRFKRKVVKPSRCAESVQRTDESSESIYPSMGTEVLGSPQQPQKVPQYVRRQKLVNVPSHQEGIQVEPLDQPRHMAVQERCVACSGLSKTAGGGTTSTMSKPVEFQKEWLMDQLTKPEVSEHTDSEGREYSRGRGLRI
mmetsp:Transcript_992/g.2136  ORF Transcript_992/g.2136 Transcript_992/m.2136 type:complete len:409 (-) Transcript_992:252-1478(-)